eukprot:763400-Hanusia_phi.AAC.1
MMSSKSIRRAPRTRSGSLRPLLLAMLVICCIVVVFIQKRARWVGEKHWARRVRVIRPALEGKRVCWQTFSASFAAGKHDFLATSQIPGQTFSPTSNWRRVAIRYDTPRERGEIAQCLTILLIFLLPSPMHHQSAQESPSKSRRIPGASGDNMESSPYLPWLEFVNLNEV